MSVGSEVHTETAAEAGDHHALQPLAFDQFLRNSSARRVTRSITSCEANAATSASVEPPTAGISSVSNFSNIAFMARAGLRRNSELRMRVKIQTARSSTDCRSI